MIRGKNYTLYAKTRSDFDQLFKMIGDKTGNTFFSQLRDKEDNYLADFVITTSYDETTNKTSILMQMDREILDTLTIKTHEWDLKMVSTREKIYIGGDFVLEKGKTD